MNVETALAVVHSLESTGINYDLLITDGNWEALGTPKQCIDKYMNDDNVSLGEYTIIIRGLLLVRN